MLAGLEASNRVRQIWLDRRAKPEPKLERIVALAREQKIEVVAVDRGELDAVSRADVHNGVIAFATPLQQPSLKEVLDRIDAEGREPFLVLLDQVQYEQNLGAILRTAAAAGVDAVVVPTRRGAGMSSTVQRVAMGGAEVVPLVRESMTSASATLLRRGIPIIGAEANGDCPYWEADFTGAVAIALGGEDRGLGQKVRERCHQVVSIPIDPDGPVTSLNVSVAAGILLFERARRRG